MKEQMNIVVVGHVDHGKSTLIGRLLADTKTLPEGKLEQVKAFCKANSRPFEYAFLLDALKDEQSQGITIDSARSFFKTRKRDYIIIDAPGHIEFLKNMVSGAARAEGAILLIDANEGIMENSKRHGYLLSMLGIKQVVVAVNKIDLVLYDKKIFDNIEKEYREFLAKINIEPKMFIPISSMQGDNLVSNSDNMPWYKGKTILQAMDTFKKEPSKKDKDFRMPVQDIYKFTADDDDRRIFAGRVVTGNIKVGQKVVFLPSGKTSRINSIEEFNASKRTSVAAERSTGFTLDSQVYIKPGEILCKQKETPALVGSLVKTNIFWMSKQPMVKNKKYKLKLGAVKVSCVLKDVLNVLDASELSTVSNKEQIDRHDVAECLIETVKPIAFDLVTKMEDTGRFVIVDDYEISGGGIVLENIENKNTILQDHIDQRESTWEKGNVSTNDRTAMYGHKSKFIVFTGNDRNFLFNTAKALEKKLFEEKYKVYYMGFSNIEHGLDSDLTSSSSETDVDESFRRIGELARIITDTGLIFIVTIFELDDFDIERLKMLNKPNDALVISANDNNFNKFIPDLSLDQGEPINDAVDKACKLLRDKDIKLEYYL